MSAGAKARRAPTDRAPRAAGLLLHPTSLPGRFAIGDLGPGATAMLEWMLEAGLSIWQILPLGPTGLGHSPYNSLSAFAGNPLLISPEALVTDQLLDPRLLADGDSPPAATVDFTDAARYKNRVLRAAFETHRRAPDGSLGRELAAFATAGRRRLWLDDWSLFAALRERHGERSWIDWPAALRDREPRALEAARLELAEPIAFQHFQQFIFFRQWRSLRRAASAHGIRILGDVPIYVALDSADVWAHRELFELEPDGRPSAVAGVPPDYFSVDGQRWGNPLYRWQEMERTGYGWWMDRLAHELERADLVRLDHFRGFVAYWRVAAKEKTARRGRWVKGPGEKFFATARRRLGGLPFLAEDLGDIDEPVRRLRRKLGLPGMHVLQFAFAAEDSLHAPHRHEADAAVYTGTHDNDTTRGWLASAGEDERNRALTYLGAAPESISWSMVRAALASVAALALVPLQDLLDLGSEARMNLPARASGNWTWRALHGDVPGTLPARLRELVAATARLPPPPMPAVSPDGAPRPAG